ncbi:DUF4164 family protein [Phreatobacter sp.]|uniref:DUF4164 family protein n=1 Tax=Phreatobacter sp. TaxID=1966341 RepID=UPI003F703D3F
MAVSAEPSRLDRSAERLSAALARLDAAVARKQEAERAQGAAARQIEAFQADRARLADELDRSAERIATLEAANRDVARRLDMTMEAIRSVLKSYGA